MQVKSLTQSTIHSLIRYLSVTKVQSAYEKCMIVISGDQSSEAVGNDITVALDNGAYKN